LEGLVELGMGESRQDKTQKENKNNKKNKSSSGAHRLIN